MSPHGLSAAALRYWETRQAVVSNNLANMGTPGFKAERVFAEALRDATLQARSATDHTDGELNPTGRPLDLAIVGDGYLVVDTPDSGERWIRGGSLALDGDGRIIDPAGRPVLGRRGPIELPPGEIEIARNGDVRVDGQPIDTLRVERPRGDVVLEREGASLWVPAANKQRVAPDEIDIRQSHLEDSNVDPVGALVEMIDIQRAYAAVQRSIQTETAALQTITTDIGRVG